MDELDKIINPKEKVLWKGKPEYTPYMIGSVLMALISSIFIIVVFLILGTLFLPNGKYILIAIIVPLLFITILLFANLSFKATHYAVTNKRLIYQTGIIGRDFISVDYDKIQNASVAVGLIGVMFKTGNVNVFTGKMKTIRSKHGSRTISVHDTFKHINKPYEILKLIQQHLSQRKESLYSGHAYEKNSKKE